MWLGDAGETGVRGVWRLRDAAAAACAARAMEAERAMVAVWPGPPAPGDVFVLLQTETLHTIRRYSERELAGYVGFPIACCCMFAIVTEQVTLGEEMAIIMQ